MGAFEAYINGPSDGPTIPSSNEETSHGDSRRTPEPQYTLSKPDYARFLVMCYENELRKSKGLSRRRFKEDEVLLVWFSKTLDNWKALVITTLPDKKYYEVTHNGQKKETYVDAYDMIDSVAYRDPE